MPKYTGPLRESVELAIFQTRLAAALTEMRKQKLFKTGELASRVEISNTYMVDIMRGKANISLSLLVAFCLALDVKVTDLIGNTADTSVDIPAGARDVIKSRIS